MPLIDVEQHSPEWLALRLGKVTGSRMCDVLARTKTGSESASRRNYRAELVVEILTGKTPTHYFSKEMEWGIENEAFAIAAYEMAFDVNVETCGFFTHDTNERFGSSPDGLIGADGLIEVKCPNTSTHISYILNGKVPSEYEPQMLAEMACSGRQWVDFISFDPCMPERMQLFVKRFPRDEARIREIEKQVEFFLAEVDEVVEMLRRKSPEEPF